MNYEDKIELLFDGSSGIYIPQRFAREMHRSAVSYVSEEDYKILQAGPEHPQYWDAWVDVLDNAQLTGSHNQMYTLFQDGDVWAIREDMTDQDWEDWQGL